MTKPRIAIGYPSPEKMDYRFQQDLLNLIFKNWLEFDFYPINAVGSRIVMNRNQIVKEAKLWGADYILWIDSDTKFPHTGLKRLMAHNKDIVCATTSRRLGENRSPAAYPMDIRAIQPLQRLVLMKFIGFPFMLTKMSVFDKLQMPYFAEPPRRLVNVFEGMEHQSAEEAICDVMPEDEYFCWRVREAGFEILCDMELTMEIGHIGTTVYYVQNPLPPGSTGNIAFEPQIDLRLGQSDESYHRARDGIGE